MDDRLYHLIAGIAASNTVIARCIEEREKLRALSSSLANAEPSQECFDLIAEVCDLNCQNDTYEAEAREQRAFFQRKMATYA